MLLEETILLIDEQEYREDYFIVTLNGTKF